MITFNQLGQHGRLGNQLFQYAILLAVGAKNNYEIGLPKLENKKWHGQKCQLNNFNITAKEFENVLTTNQYIEKESQNFSYNPDIFEIPDNTNILGFFQNYQYYKDYEDLIIKELTIKSDILDRNNETLIKIKEKYEDYLIVSLHIRRGDTDLGMYGDSTKLDTNSKWYKYFMGAKEVFGNTKVKFLVFTGGNRVNDNPDSDYSWCRNNLNSDEYIYSDHENTTINDFSLMYLSDAHILSPISTLSWWVGFLNKKKKKITISPEKYYFLEKEMERGFYPDNFILK